MDTCLFVAVHLLWKHATVRQKARIKGLTPTTPAKPLKVVDRRDRVYKALYGRTVDMKGWVSEVLTDEVKTQGDLMRAVYRSLCYKKLPILTTTISLSRNKRKAVDDGPTDDDVGATALVQLSKEGHKIIEHESCKKDTEFKILDILNGEVTFTFHGQTQELLNIKDIMEIFRHVGMLQEKNMLTKFLAEFYPQGIHVHRNGASMGRVSTTRLLKCMDCYTLAEEKI